MIETLAISNYRTLRDIVLPLSHINVVTGPNGSGKSNLYKALRLISSAANGNLISDIAKEGGIQSIFWAGLERLSRDIRDGTYPVEGKSRRAPRELKLGFGASDLSYAIDLGLPAQDNSSLFSLDPVIKRETIWSGPLFRRSSILTDRRGSILQSMSEQGSLERVPLQLSPFYSVLSEFSDPRLAPEVYGTKAKIRNWRFYDSIRTDQEAPCRFPQVGTFTPIVDQDGRNYAAALQTIIETGDHAALTAAIEDAFPGAVLQVEARLGWFEIAIKQHGLLRPLSASELSDGTLRYLILIATLLSPRPPELFVLNEPETSLHQDLIMPLARLIQKANQQSQFIIVTHNDVLRDSLMSESDANLIRLEKDFGETMITGQSGIPNWGWPPR